MKPEESNAINDYLWDGSGPPDVDTRKLEAVLAGLRHGGEAPTLVIGTRPELRLAPSAALVGRQVVIARPAHGRWMSIAAMVALAVVAGWIARPALGPWLKIETRSGNPRIGSAAAGDRLHVGQWLNTDGQSSAEIEVASIGHVTVEPNSRIRVKTTGKNEHILEVPYGQIHAFITAPPRVFLVDTPAARAVDMGCAYTLDVQKDGSGLLRVTLGHVLLEGHGRTSDVPMFGGTCRTRRGFGPGTPYFDDASTLLIAALEKFDFGGGSDTDLQAVLDEARDRDALSLWHLLSRTEGEQRQRVYSKLAASKPLPARTTKEAVMSLESEALQAWFESMRPF